MTNISGDHVNGCVAMHWSNGPPASCRRSPASTRSPLVVTPWAATLRHIWDPRSGQVQLCSWVAGFAGMDFHGFYHQKKAVSGMIWKNGKHCWYLFRCWFSGGYHRVELRWLNLKHVIPRMILLLDTALLGSMNIFGCVALEIGFAVGMWVKFQTTGRTINIAIKMGMFQQTLTENCHWSRKSLTIGRRNMRIIVRMQICQNPIICCERGLFEPLFWDESGCALSRDHIRSIPFRAKPLCVSYGWISSWTDYVMNYWYPLMKNRKHNKFPCATTNEFDCTVCFSCNRWW